MWADAVIRYGGFEIRTISGTVHISKGVSS
jgi:hypothetical protein